MIKLKTTAAVAALTASFGGAASVQAQVFDDEIIVTAQKREQSAQDVGIALTTLSGEQLDQLGFEGSADIAAHTPGLAVGAVGTPAVTIFNIRGVNQNDFTDHHESPIAVYVDDAYVAAITAVGFQMFDLERVEVLKGPQGTLFGRNTTGGLIHYVSAKPTNEVEAYGSIQGGSFGQIKAEAALSGPLGDGVAGRLSAVVHQHNGWLENTIGRDRHETDYFGVRGQLLFDIGENAELLIKGHYGKNNNEATGAWVNLVSQPGPDGRGVPVDPTDNAWGGGPGANFFGYRDDNLEDLSGAYDFSGFHDRDVYGGTATLRYNISDNVNFVAISDYRKVEKAYAEDAEGSPDPLLNYAATTDLDQFSQEVRLEGEIDRLNWIGGVYYLYLDGDFGTKIWDAPDFTSIFAVVPGSTFDVTNEFSQKKRSWSIFGQAEYAFTDQFSLIGGIRYTRDKVSFEDLIYDPGSLAVGGVLTVFQEFSEATVGDLATTKDDLINWKAQLEWRSENGILIYAGVTEGTKGPGYASNLDATKTLADFTYGSETLRNYEAGFKASIFDGSARFNGSFYYYDYDDYQAFDLSGLVTRITNVDAEIMGLELELVANPFEGLEFLIGANFLFDATLQDLPLGGATFDRDLPLAPEVSLNGLVRYEYPVGDNLTAAAQIDASYVSEHNFAVQNHETTFEDGYALLNARLSLAGGEDSNWELSVFGKNLTDERYKTYGIDVSGFAFTQLQFGPPRWWGGEVSYRF